MRDSSASPSPCLAALTSFAAWSKAIRCTARSFRTAAQRRTPEKLLEFYGVRPGMRVLDMSAAAGYNTELLARVVGPKGTVYAQNTPFMLQNFIKGRFDERMKRPVMSNVVPLAREF